MKRCSQTILLSLRVLFLNEKEYSMKKKKEKEKKM